MCGIAGLIHRDGATSVGKEMTAMLKSLKHRGPDSTGFAVYGTSTANEYVMRLKLAEQEDMPRTTISAKRSGRGSPRSTGGSPSSALRPSRSPKPRLMPSAIACAIPATRGGCRRYRANRGRRGPVLRQRARADQGSRRRDPGVGAIWARHVPRHAWHRSHPHGDGVRCRYPLGPSYWAYPYNDIAVVHNGQITNYWIMRREMSGSATDSCRIATPSCSRSTPPTISSRGRRSRIRSNPRSRTSTACSPTSSPQKTSSASNPPPTNAIRPVAVNVIGSTRDHSASRSRSSRAS